MNFVNRYISDLKSALDGLPDDRIETIVETLHTARLNGQQVFIMGNGGSASTSTHFVCDLAKNTDRPGLPGFRVIGLADNMAMFSALANDLGYENVFANQLKNLVRENDIVIAISGSGNSENVVRAVELANQAGAVTIGLTGMSGGRLANLVGMEIRVPSYNIQHVEDVHLMLEHMICSALNDMAEETQAIELDQIAYSPEEGFIFNPADGNYFDPARQEASDRGCQPVTDDDSGSKSMILNQMLQLTMGSTGAKSGTIILLDPEGKVVDGAQIIDGRVLFPCIEQLAEISQEGLAGWVIRNRQSAVIPNTRSDNRWLQRPWETTRKRSRSAISVPLTDAEKVLGAITLVHPLQGRFSSKDVDFVSRIANAVSASIQALDRSRS